MSARRLNPNAYEAFASLMDRRGLERQRRRVGSSAAGVVLEIGVGTGRNLPHFTAATRIVGVDPHPEMLTMAAARARDLPWPVDLVVGSAESLPFRPASFDTVVITLTLCTVSDPAAAIAEVRRVLAAYGTLIFLEHERSRSTAVARLQDLATPLWSRVSGGCHLNRSTVATIRDAGFDITESWRARHGRSGLVQGTATVARG
ncbi:MAG: class I SAM-dependent methyltransferase [Actinobacteria bacterium]|nr:MAG: class I SAM-dependent methyltransferase [Actinomycetota bacterium]